MGSGMGLGKGLRLCAGILGVILLAGPCWGESATVSYADGRPAERVEILQRDGTDYIAVSEIARLLGLETELDWELQRVTLRGEGHSVEVLIGGTVWIRDGETISAGEASLPEGRDVYIGLGSAQEFLAPAFENTLRWDESGRRIMIGLPAPNILDLEVRAVRGRVSAHIRTDGVLRFEQQPLGDGGFEIFVKGGVLARRLEFDSESGLIERVESRQETGGARIVFTLGAGRLSHKVFPSRSPDGIVALVWERALSDIPEPEFRPPRRLAWEDRFSSERLEVDLIVIDPGHGGENFGSLGPSGFAEKEYNLQVARRLKEAFQREGIDVILTRNDDVFVDLETRTEVANSVGADLFISVHANGYRSPDARGFEVYFLSPALEDEARTVEAMENAGAGIVSAGGLEPDEDVAFILWDTAQNEFVAESSYLAQLVDTELAMRLTIPNRGVKQANFVVLKGAYLPAVLLESGFITNPQEEALLKDEAFQTTVVEGVVAAVRRFKEDYNR
jgi:N-acetylmuramoyl-L-alanine amidase